MQTEQCSTCYAAQGLQTANNASMPHQPTGVSVTDAPSQTRDIRQPTLLYSTTRRPPCPCPRSIVPGVLPNCSTHVVCLRQPAAPCRARRPLA